jgi:hypothetical protein
MRRVLPAILSLLFFYGCTYPIKFINPQDGKVLVGEYNKSSKTITVTLPSGEVLTGEYVALTNASIGFGSMFYGANVGSMMTVGAGGTSNAYALLTGDKGTVMEIIASYSEWTGHGFGQAKTNKGEEYRVMF